MLSRKLRNHDSAVSPVIAVILMVAITVVLAATVYVWVSGFGAGGTQPAKTLSLASASAITNGDKIYTVASGTTGLKWSDLNFTLDGGWRPQAQGATCSSDIANATYYACRGSTQLTADDVVQAGDLVRLGGASSGQTLRVLDSQANSVILTLAVG